MKNKITICIPTYNRAPFLAELLDSIIAQGQSGLQLAISDNASTDNTMEIIENAKLRFPNLIYYCWPTNMGADRNYLKVVEIADGEYCWLMGSDDILPNGAIKRMMEIISNDDIYLIGRTETNFLLKKERNQQWLRSKIKRKDFSFSDKNKLIEYFEDCSSLGGVFSYLSSIIVRREKWNAVTFDEKFIGTAYSHVYILLSILLSGGRLGYYAEPLVISRGGNDSFLIDWIRRGLLDLKGYAKLADGLIRDHRVRMAFLGIMKHEHTLIKVIKMKAMSDGVDWHEYKYLLKEVYKFPLWFIPIVELTSPFARILYVMKIKLKKINNSAG